MKKFLYQDLYNLEGEQRVKKKFTNSCPSDFKLSNRLFDFVLNNLSRLELFIAQKSTIPFGTSILAVAKKNV